MLTNLKKCRENFASRLFHTINQNIALIGSLNPNKYEQLTCIMG